MNNIILYALSPFWAILVGMKVFISLLIKADAWADKVIKNWYRQADRYQSRETIFNPQVKIKHQEEAFTAGKN